MRASRITRGRKPSPCIRLVGHPCSFQFRHQVPCHSRAHLQTVYGLPLATQAVVGTVCLATIPERPKSVPFCDVKMLLVVEVLQGCLCVGDGLRSHALAQGNEEALQKGSDLPIGGLKVALRHVVTSLTVIPHSNREPLGAQLRLQERQSSRPRNVGACVVGASPLSTTAKPSV